MADDPSVADASRSASSHDRILIAAKQLFASRGYENTSTVAIARQAGTSESQLMKHFGSKEGLLEAIFDDGWNTLTARVSELNSVASPRDRLRKLLELMLAAMERDPDLKKLMLLEGRRIRKEGQMVMITSGFLQFVRFLDGILADMRSAGQLRSDISNDALRSALMGMFEGMLRDQLLAQKTGFPSRVNAADLKHIFDIFIPALAPAK